MNLTITQDNTRTETINSSIIDKLYEIAFAASSDPNSTVSLTGRLESPKGYKFKIDWLNTNFSPDLTITVPSSGLYMTFYDSAVENILKTSIGDGNGVGILSIHDLQDLNSLGFVNNTDITDFREGVLFDNTSIATSAGFVNGCTNLDIVGVPPYLTRWTSLITYDCTPSKIVISNWNNWVCPILVANGQYLCDIKHDLCTLNADNTLSVITSINLPEGVNFPSGHLMFGGFFNSKVTTVNIPTSVTRLNSFQGSDILTITFTQGSTLSSIEEYCFYDCTSLALNVSNLPQTLTTIGDQAFRSCSNVTGVLDLPNLTSLGQYSFYSTGITSVTNLGSVTNIPNYSFTTCTNLTSVILPSTVTSIGNGAFYNCSNLANINLPSLNSIGYSAFEGTKITKFDVRNSTFTTIPSCLLKDCYSLTEVRFPTTVTYANEQWCPYVNSLFVTGLDNITDRSRYNYLVRASQVINPVIQKTTDNSNILFGANDRAFNIHSLFIPFITKTSSANGNYYGTPHGTWLTYRALGSVNKCFTCNLLYLRDIEYFNEYSFFCVNATNLVINNTTPPDIIKEADNDVKSLGSYSSWENTIFPTGVAGAPNIGTLWVPDSAVATYLTDPLYSGLTIKGINTKTNGTDYDLPRFATFADWETAYNAAKLNNQPSPVGLIEEYM